MSEKFEELFGKDAVFTAPWQARAFAIARMLCESGEYSWDEFRARLIDAVGADASSHGGRDDYYDRFLEALEKVVESKRIVSADALQSRVTELGTDAPSGHSRDKEDRSGR